MHQLLQGITELLSEQPLNSRFHIRKFEKSLGLQKAKLNTQEIIELHLKNSKQDEKFYFVHRRETVLNDGY